MLVGSRILIIGAGIGGLATALALAARGASVTIFEQASEIQDVGAGLQISPNGMRVLQALGLGDAVRCASVIGQAVSLRDGLKAREVAQLDLTILPAEQSYYFVHRADVIGLLSKAVEEAGAEMRLDHRLTEVSSDGNLIFEHGDNISADLVIGADGLKSRVRPVLNGDSDPSFTGQVAWRALVPNTMNHSAQARVHMGPGRHVVSYPVRDGEIVNLVAVQERDTWAGEDWHLKDDPAHMAQAFADFGSEVRELIEGIQTCHLWGLFRHPVADHWHDGTKSNGSCRMALVGDAAHPMLPFLAQGANMALEDAWVLAECLACFDTPSAALVAYQTRRRDRVSRVINAANGNAWKYHLRRGPVRYAAHTGLRIVSRVAPGVFLNGFDWLYGHDVTAPAEA
ncbi:MAG: FAD-dependent oxidoreductase [Marinovum sp.]|nr:FAD-dependent oxidoreductase [Marinovum sp.]